MSPETQAGLGSIVVLLAELLWWGGLAGVVALVAASVTSRRHPVEPITASAPTVDVQWPLRLALAVGAASAVHLAMAPVHLGEGVPHAAFFALTGLGQLWLAARLLLRPSDDVLRLVAVSGAALIGLWAVSRTVGVLGEREVVGSWDLCVVLWQGWSVREALRRVGEPVPGRWHPPSPVEWSVRSRAAGFTTGLVLLVLPWSGSHG